MRSVRIASSGRMSKPRCPISGRRRSRTAPRRPPWPSPPRRGVIGTPRASMRGAADQILGHVEGDDAAAVHPVDHAAHFAHHLGADAVARQDQQLLVGGHRTFLAIQPSGDRRASRRARRGCAARSASMCCRVLQRLADVVQAVQQQVLAEGVDLEVDFLAVRPHHHLPLQIDGERALPPSCASSISMSQTARGRRIGRMPFLKQLL